MNNKANVVIPVEDYLYRWAEEQAFEQRQRRNALFSNPETQESDIEKLSKPFEIDVRKLQKAYPYTWTEAMLDTCRERLVDSRTSKIAIEVKQRYYLVKPTIKAEFKDANIEVNTNTFGTIEIKKHTPWKHPLKYTEYTPTYMILKSGEESVV